MSDHEPDPTHAGVSRRGFLGRSAATVGSLSLGGLASGAAGAEAAAQARLSGMNVVMFITDQERAIQHFPRGWAQRNLPGLTALQRNGITFDNAFTNSCMCSPARSTLMSGYFPAQHGVKYTLELDMSPPQNPQVPLPTPDTLANIATVMSSAGYNVIYKGKFHCCKPAGATWAPSDLANYGFSRWNPADAGADQSIPEMGGGLANNDGRFMTSVGDYTEGDEGALSFIRSAAAAEQPFFMIVSLVNPHDVLAYPRNAGNAGYSNEWLAGDIRLPLTEGEDLRTKPSAQEEFLRIFNLTGKLKTRQQKLNYLNFYGNLMRASDNYLVNLMAALKSVKTGNRSRGPSLLDNTLIIRTSDHGEMGLAHGGLRQKNFNFYEESLRVPLIYSNPRLYPKPLRSSALVSHVDFLPTLAGLFGAPPAARSAWQGRDYSKLVLNRSRAPVQDYIVFTFDDFQAGQATGPYVQPPQHIVSIREQRWKLAEYFDPRRRVRSQWEMYDLKHDPHEVRNLARPGARRTATQEAQYQRLRAKLERVQETRLQPLGPRVPA
ncbi:MAG: sulfatase-like hydrolase/transferase [Solirubrobacteraceae bacterium]